MRYRAVAKSIEWLGAHELTVLIALFVIVVGTWVFLGVADEVVEGDTQAMDERIVRALRRPENPATPIGPPWVTDVARDVTALGGFPVLALVTLAAAGFLRLAGKRATMWFVLTAIVSGYLLSTGLKAIFSRPRPDIVPHLAEVSTSSFPSGHSMMAAVVYMTLGTLLTRVVARNRLKFYFLLVGLLLTGLVGLSRIYLGVHYPTDVLAGWSAGLAWSTLCWLIANALEQRGIMTPNRE